MFLLLDKFFPAPSALVKLTDLLNFSNKLTNLKTINNEQDYHNQESDVCWFKIPFAYSSIVF